MFKTPLNKPIPTEEVKDDLPSTIDHPALKQSHIIPIGVGIDKEITIDLEANAHTLIVGDAGSGKTNLVNTILAHLLLDSSDWQIYAYDPKDELSSFSRFEKIKKIATSLNDTVRIFDYLHKEINTRMQLVEKEGRYKVDYLPTPLPSIMFIIQDANQIFDENWEFLYDLPEIKDKLDLTINMLKQYGAFLDIHVVLSTPATSRRFSNDSSNIVLRGDYELELMTLLGSLEGVKILDTATNELIAGRGYLRQGHSVEVEKFQAYLTRDTWCLKALNNKFFLAG